MSKNLSKDELFTLLSQKDSEMTLQQKLRLTVLLSVPAIIAQLSFIIMEMIDASMLGHLSTNQAAAVGLVSTTIWLFGGFTSAFGSGFSVQVAHKMGARDAAGARSMIRQGILSGLLFSLILTAIGLIVAPFLPHWLNADESIAHDATVYLSIFSLGMPLIVLNSLAAGSLRCSGNIKVPSLLMVIMCTLDVIFNYIFIFMFNLGTAGAALGTWVAYFITVSRMMWYLTRRDRNLRFSLDNMGSFHSRKAHGGWKETLRPYLPTRKTLREAFHIGAPISMERGLRAAAQVAITTVIAPMGNIAIAANSFAINVESLCYMPGYGIAEAATTLVGQSKGARRKDLMHSFAWITMGLGMFIMALMGVIMWAFAPEMMSLITNDSNVVTLGAEVLRIEAWAEPGFAAAIVGYSICIGAGTTFVPALLNLGSIWGVRVTLTLLLAGRYGLHGVWMAMAGELTVRGLLFIFRLLHRDWSKLSDTDETTESAGQAVEPHDPKLEQQIQVTMKHPQ